MTGLELLAVAMGMRHGLDPDHLAEVDGLARLRPSPWIGLLFALGHGAVVTLLAFPAALVLQRIPWEEYHLFAWLLLLVGGLTLYRQAFSGRGGAQWSRARLPVLNPLLLGALFGLGFETASQISALALSAQMHPLRLGLLFTLGMALVDGVDGLLAARLQGLAQDSGCAQRASGLLAYVVAFTAIGLALAEFLALDLEALSLPLGLFLFTLLLSLRVYALGAFFGRA